MKLASRLNVTKIVTSYICLALLWIAGSDYLADSFSRRPAIHTYKGAAFVLFTGALLFLVLRRAEGSLRDFEKDLLASREQFRRVIENAPEAIFIQIDSKFHYVNPAALSLFRAGAPEELLGRPVLDRVHEESREAARLRLEALRQRTEPLTAIEHRFLRLDGTIVEVEVSAAPFEMAGNRGALVFVRDVSDRKAADRQKRHLEEQMQQAQKMESIGCLAGGVAHDFNNLLTVINGYSDMLLTSLPESGSDWAFVRDIRDAGERAAGLAGQLLTFSRKNRPEPSVIDLNETVREVERMLRRLIGDHILIALDLSPQVLTILADPTSMNQLLMNLVVNARDAMPDGGTIRICTSHSQLDESECADKPGLRPGSFVRLSVSDTGQGIPPEIQSRIFEPFFTTKQAQHGTGLGLSTVYGIVRDAAGWIRVDSLPQSGTTMQMWFPVHTQGGLGDAGLYQNGGLCGSEVILLAEDNDAVRKTTKTILARYGYVVLSAGSGHEAIELARRCDCRIDLLLTDIMMPHMSGHQLIERMRERDHTLKALLMSGYRGEEVPGFQQNIDVPCIAKPFRPEELARRVRDVLNCGG